MRCTSGTPEDGEPVQTERISDSRHIARRIRDLPARMAGRSTVARTVVGDRAETRLPVDVLVRVAREA